MNYSETINDLTSQGKLCINLGLERITKIMDLLGNPQDKLKCIQVAGTNGKGSVCTILSSIFKHAGYKVGLYTSPHIFDYTERIKINEVNISKDEFAEYYSNIIKFANKHNINLTEFEILTAIMYKYFYDNEIDVAIIETGLGGRFDATNIIKTNLCAIITHIDLDHTVELGNTKDKIAFEKAGIIKPNSIVITSEGYEAIKDKADKLKSMLVLTPPYCENKFIDALSLKGFHQVENLSLALTALRLLPFKIKEEDILIGLSKVQNPFRFEYRKDKNILIDGAHNPNCFSALIKNLDIYFPNTKRNYVFGCLNTKDYKKMIEYIINDEGLNNLYFYHFNNKKSCTFGELSKIYPKAIELKTKADLHYSTNILTVICGSFYMINELIKNSL